MLAFVRLERLEFLVEAGTAHVGCSGRPYLTSCARSAKSPPGWGGCHRWTGGEEGCRDGQGGQGRSGNAISVAATS